MKRMSMIVSSLLLGTPTIMGGNVQAEETGQTEKKNVLFLIMDDLRTEFDS